MQTFHIISNTMVKSAQHHRPSLNLLLQQHKFPEVQDLVWGFFTWTQPQQPVLGMSHRAHFSMVSCRSIRQNYSPLTISPLWAAWVFPNPVEWQRPLKQQLPTCTEETATRQRGCLNPDVPRCVCDHFADGSICVTCPYSSYFCSLSSCNPLP